jgi:hypothetical protein
MDSGRDMSAEPAGDAALVPASIAADRSGRGDAQAPSARVTIRWASDTMSCRWASPWKLSA